MAEVKLLESKVLKEKRLLAGLKLDKWSITSAVIASLKGETPACRFETRLLRERYERFLRS